MHFSTAVASVQSHVGHIKGVEISYCDRQPLQYDLTIKLSQVDHITSLRCSKLAFYPTMYLYLYQNSEYFVQDGIRLVFDSISQRLKVVEVYDLSLVRLKYGLVLLMFSCLLVFSLQRNPFAFSSLQEFHNFP